jgi:hypothetical protein
MSAPRGGGRLAAMNDEHARERSLALVAALALLAVLAFSSVARAATFCVNAG